MDIQQASSAAVQQFSAKSFVAPAEVVSPQPRPQPEVVNKAQKVDAVQLKQAVNHINEIVQAINPGVEFTVDSATSISVVTVVDVQNQEVLRQFPSNAVLAIAETLDQLQGLLIKQKV